MNEIIIIDHLSYAYGNQKVFKNLSLSIFEHEWIAIIGPNGSGKTTFLKLLLGHLDAKGAICLKTNSIGYVPQVIECNEHLPICVWDVLLMADRLPFIFKRHNQRSIDRAHFLLKELQLESIKDKLFSSLSLGQKQRTLFARALFSNPELLILDEPLASVDAQSSTIIYNILRRLKGKMTMLFVTHEIQHLIQDVDRILCLNQPAQLLKPKELCEHFAMGLYHTPLVDSICLT